MPEPLARRHRPVEDVVAPLLAAPMSTPAPEVEPPVSPEEQARRDALKANPHYDLPANIELGSD